MRRRGLRRKVVECDVQYGNFKYGLSVILKLECGHVQGGSWRARNWKTAECVPCKIIQQAMKTEVANGRA